MAMRSSIGQEVTSLTLIGVLNIWDIATAMAPKRFYQHNPNGGSRCSVFTALVGNMSVPPPSTGPTVDVRLIYGPFLLGVMFNLILFGASQLTYVQTALKDPLWIRILVWHVFIVETANSAFDIALVYEPLVLQYGQFSIPKAPNNLPSVFITHPICVLLVAFPIQMFFLWRIRMLTQNNVILGIIFIFSLVGLGGGIWTTVMVQVAGKFSRIPLLYRSAEVWFISSSVTDVCIAVRLAFALRKQKTGIRATDTVVDKIIRSEFRRSMIDLVIELMTTQAFFGILDVTTFLILPFYSNCLMSALNARTHLRTTSGPVGQLSLSRTTQQSLSLGGPNYKYGVDGKLPQDTLQDISLDTFANHTETPDAHANQAGIRVTTVVERV
ncbi:hypothetical protein C8R44DRAFT_820259 [Mycena epipterygia]|nr:hypothetical protein C8R44DRAFT_820259 [Mycena epipterygia]